MPTPRLLGMLCIRNEVDRYLRECLVHHFNILDDIFVYDDQSEDDGFWMAAAHGCYTEIRPNNVPAFLEHEGQFRQAAWEAFEIALRPTEDDWVLAFDADEFLVCPRQTDAAVLLRAAAVQLATNQSVGCRFKIHEVFAMNDGGVPMVRTDGYWGDITGLRFFQYRVGGKFANRRLGGGSTPDYVTPSEECSALEFLHFGYARLEDRLEKYRRYSGRPGHSSAHINSIVQPATLAAWNGEVPL